MTAITVQVNVSIKVIDREDISSPRTPADLPLTKAMKESGQDQSNTTTVVTPRSVYVYHLPCKFKPAIQETNISASAELVC